MTHDDMSSPSLQQLIDRAIRHNPNTCLLCHSELFWFRHSCEPLYITGSQGQQFIRELTLGYISLYGEAKLDVKATPYSK